MNALVSLLPDGGERVEEELVSGWTLIVTNELEPGLSCVTRWSDHTIWLDVALAPNRVPFVLMRALMQALGGRPHCVTAEDNEREVSQAASVLLETMGLDVLTGR